MLKLASALLLLLACTSVSAQSRIIENTAFNEKGVMGQTVVEEKDRFHLNADTKLAWNNRRYSVKETVVLDARGYPVKIDIEGISAFGAPIKESFERSNGVARWTSLKETGESTEAGFYLPADHDDATLTALMRAILSADNKEVSLLPRGVATAEAVGTRLIKQGENQQRVTLYALKGLDLMPDYIWMDENLNIFATGEPSGGHIRKGLGKKALEPLAEVKNDAQREHMATMATALAQDYDTLLFSNVRVVDVVQKQLLTQQDVLLRDGTIIAVTDHSPTASADKIIDATGKTLIPGLWDMHGHLDSPEGAFYIAAGVTSVRDIGNAHEQIMRVERQFNSGKVIGPNLYRSGFMDQFSEFSSGRSVKDLEEAHDTIDFFADNGYAQLKLYSSISPEWVPELTQHAHTRGMRVSGHIPAFMNAEQAVDAGFDEIQHINMLFLTFLGGESIDTRKQLRFSIPAENSHKVDLDSDRVNAFVQKLKNQRVVVDPTLSTFRSMYMRRENIVDPENLRIAENLPPQFLRGSFLGAEMDIPRDQLDDYNLSAQAFSAMVKKLHDAGIWIVPGTDHPGVGLALQQELIDYADAGIAPIDVLELATLGSARLVGAAYRSGSVTVGKDADLVLLADDPLESMDALDSAVLVVKGNKYYQPADLFDALNIVPFAGTTKVLQGAASSKAN
ncbi:MAG: amidohydrolase family protein [Halioglobus sp.]